MKQEPLTEREAEYLVERRHSRKMRVDPVQPALAWGFGLYMLMYVLQATGLGEVNHWAALAVSAAVGVGIHRYHSRKNLEMLREAWTLMGIAPKGKADPP